MLDMDIYGSTYFRTEDVVASVKLLAHASRSVVSRA